MKKLIILGLVLLMVVGFGTIALAKADVQNLEPYTYYPGQTKEYTISPDASGKAIVNNSKGNVVLEITVSAKGLDSEQVYTVSLIATGQIWFPLGVFTTNANGNGHYHINLSEEDLITLAEDNLGDSADLEDALEHVMISIGEMDDASMHAVLMEEEF